MTDCELLKLAANAYNINTERCLQYSDGAYNYKGKVGRWNPLTDDGDALRLAVLLDIEFYQGDDDGPSVYAGYWSKPKSRDVTRLFSVEPISGEPYAATRRAIVRAAAEIGKDME